MIAYIINFQKYENKSLANYLSRDDHVHNTDECENHLYY